MILATRHRADAVACIQKTCSASAGIWMSWRHRLSQTADATTTAESLISSAALHRRRRQTPSRIKTCDATSILLLIPLTISPTVFRCAHLCLLRSQLSSDQSQRLQITHVCIHRTVLLLLLLLSYRSTYKVHTATTY